jgi:hypothetical protein
MDDGPKPDRGLALLEGRRLAIDGAMWQAPTLTLVGQVFLLTVLSDGSTRFVVRCFVALAGLSALVVVAVSLWQQRDRETTIRHYIDHAADVPAVGPSGRRPKPPNVRTWALWTFGVFPLFGVADIAALAFTCR